MDARVRDEIGLELVEIDVERTIKTKRGLDGRDNLSDETIEVGVRRTLNVKVAAADVIDGFVVDHESAVRVLKGSVGRQNGIVGLNDRGGNLGSGIHAELELGFLAVVN